MIVFKYLLFTLTIILVGCEPQSKSDRRGSLKIPPSPPADAEGEKKEFVLFKERCASCHQGESPSGGFGLMADMEKLKVSDYLIPGSPELSPVYLSIASGKMPPNNPFTEDEVKEVKDWISNLETDTRAKALGILSKRCASCHNSDVGEGGFNIANNYIGMIKSGSYVVPGQPSQSLVYTRSSPGGNMPPGGSLEAEELTALEEWIGGLKGGQIFEPIQDNLIETQIKTHLESVAVENRPFMRYFTLHQRYNSGLDYIAKSNLKSAFLKTINSLSGNQNLVKPTVIDSKGLVFALNLNDISMDRVRFDRVMTEFYPFSIVANPNVDSPLLEAQTSNQLSTESIKYLIRMDWFVATSTLPILYNELMNMPANQFQLENQLGFDSLTNIQNAQVIRSGFTNSGVSSQNRVIERHTTGDGKAWWVSYDFADTTEQEQNIFNFPLGPVGVGFDQEAFNHDGGEVIFELPNGLMGFYLSDGVGNAIDKGPLTVVSQNNGPSQYLKTIVNGISCMSCHHSGYLQKQDQVQPGSANLGLFDQLSLDKIAQIYKKPEEFKQAIDKDNEIFHKALRDLGLDPNKPDPVMIANKT
ncbi:MAG: hypothetical protein CMP10_05400, partial [Zetaproteobacteria bacterium]|nr:hypothetical protein [Pseudobdellovibrionaceae bacterium]